MDLEEKTLDDSLERTCAVCGTKLSDPEIEAARETGGPFLCAVHADEELPVAIDEAAPGDAERGDAGTE